MTAPVADLLIPEERVEPSGPFLAGKAGSRFPDLVPRSVQDPSKQQRGGNTVSSGRIAAIDYGTVRIGIAISDPDQTLASPYENYTRRGPKQDAERFRRLATEEGVARFVVGLPVHADGRESQKSSEARQFAAWLAETTGVAVDLFDERYTTREAEGFLLGAKLTKKRRKERLDKLAAQILLSAYLESRARGTDLPAPLEDY